MNTHSPSLQPAPASLASDGWLTHFRAAVMATIALTVIVSGIYPLVVWALAQMMFNHQANGSLITGADGKTVIGSELLSQAFVSPKYFHPRPSAAGNGYDPSSSGGTNFGPTSDKLLNGVADDPSTPDKDESFAGVKQLVQAYRANNGLGDSVLVPADAVTRSASGVDPHISVANARLQVSRIARTRGMSDTDVLALIQKHTQGPDLGFLGEAGVNVLELNLELDKVKPTTQP